MKIDYSYIFRSLWNNYIKRDPDPVYKDKLDYSFEQERDFINQIVEFYNKNEKDFIEEIRQIVYEDITDEVIELEWYKDTDNPDSTNWYYNYDVIYSLPFNEFLDCLKKQKLNDIFLVLFSSLKTENLKLDNLIDYTQIKQFTIDESILEKYMYTIYWFFEMLLKETYDKFIEEEVQLKVERDTDQGY